MVPDCSTMKNRLLPSGGLSITSGCTSPSANGCSFTLTWAEADPTHRPSTRTETNITVSRRIVRSPFGALDVARGSESGGILSRGFGHRWPYSTAVGRGSTRPVGSSEAATGCGRTRRMIICMIVTSITERVMSRFWAPGRLGHEVIALAQLDGDDRGHPRAQRVGVAELPRLE